MRTWNAAANVTKRSQMFEQRMSKKRWGVLVWGLPSDATNVHGSCHEQCNHDNKHGDTEEYNSTAR